MSESRIANIQVASRAGFLAYGRSALAMPTLILALAIPVGMVASAWWAKIADASHVETGIGLLCAVGLLVLWIAYKRTMSRLRAPLAIRDALQSVASGEEDLAALFVNPRFGAEAEAWNTILKRAQRVERQSLIEQAKHPLRPISDQRSELESALDFVPHGVVMIDRQGQIIFVNKAAASFLEGTSDNLLSTNLFDKIVNEKQREELLVAVASSRPHTLEVERNVAGKASVLRFRIQRIDSVESGHAIAWIEDVTQQRVAEKARHHLLAHTVHELRTPLTNIRLYAESAIEAGCEPAVQEKSLNIINSESRRLERTVTEMLSMSEADAGVLKLRRGDVRIGSMLEEIVNDYQQQAAAKHITLNLSLGPKVPTINGDREKICLALHNVIGNALKYTPDKGTVNVAVGAGPTAISITVRDTGIGIGLDEIEKIFGRFYRSKDPRVERMTGSGLGLTLAREMVRLHGGDITVDSKLDEGSVFILTLPLTQDK